MDPLIYALMAFALAFGVAAIWAPALTILSVILALGVAFVAWRSHLARKGTRIALFIVESFIALTAIQGGFGILSGSLELSQDWLAGSPFSSYTIPGLTLLVLVGGSAVLGAAVAFIEHPATAAIGVMSGAFMAAFEVVEVLSVDANVAATDLPLVVAAQTLWFVAGLVTVVLAWVAGSERRAPQLVTRGAHA